MVQRHRLLQKEKLYDMNLISQARSWLSEKNTSWESVLYNFMDSLKDGSILSKSVDVSEAKADVQSVMDCIYTIIDSYHAGKIIGALNESKQLLNNDYYIEIPIGTPLFRARGNETGFLYPKDEMFHIPFDKRYLVGNQRYSVSGLPCLYLGGSPYVCWEELGRPDYQKCNFSGFKTNESVFVYDFCLPDELKSLSDAKRAAIILACSIPADPKHVFKDEYILPQCVLQAIIEKHYNNGDFFSEDNIFGIRYYSTHYLKGDMDIFSLDDKKEEFKNRFVNYIFPSISNNYSGLSNYLLRAFEYTAPKSIMHMSIKDTAFAIRGGGDDEYASSSFGAIEDALREELGVDRIRNKRSLLFCKP